MSFVLDFSTGLELLIGGPLFLLATKFEAELLPLFSFSFEAVNLRDLEDSVDVEYNRSNTDVELRGSV